MSNDKLTNDKLTDINLGNARQQNNANTFNDKTLNDKTLNSKTPNNKTLKDTTLNINKPSPTQFKEPIRSEQFSGAGQSQYQSNDATGSLVHHGNRSTQLTPNKERSLVYLNHMTYLLYALSFFTAGLLWIVPIVINYMRRGEAQGTWLATHFDWQIKTFWYSIIIGIIGGILLFMSLGGLGISALTESTSVATGSLIMAFVGGLLFVVAIFWHLYRIIKGWIALADNRPVP